MKKGVEKKKVKKELIHEIENRATPQELATLPLGVFQPRLYLPNNLLTQQYLHTRTNTFTGTHARCTKLHVHARQRVCVRVQVHHCSRERTRTRRACTHVSGMGNLS